MKKYTLTKQLIGLPPRRRTVRKKKLPEKKAQHAKSHIVPHLVNVAGPYMVFWDWIIKCRQRISEYAATVYSAGVVLGTLFSGRAWILMGCTLACLVIFSVVIAKMSRRGR